MYSEYYALFFITAFMGTVDSFRWSTVSMGVVTEGIFGLYLRLLIEMDLEIQVWGLILLLYI